MAADVGNFLRTAGSAEFVTQAAPGVAGVFTDNRRFSQSDVIVYNERRWAKLDNALRANMAMIPVDDPEPKVNQMAELPIKFALTVASSSGVNNNDTFGITNINAAFIQAGDVLEISGVFCNSDASTYGTTKFGSGLFPEAVVVQSVTQGVTNASVVVSRGNGNDPATATALTTEMSIIHMGNTIPDSGNSPQPIHYQPAHIQNYCQFFSRTWAMSTVEEPLNHYGKMSMEQRAAMKRKEFFRLKEIAMFRGRFGKKSVAGKDQWLTGGTTEFTSLAATSIDGEDRLIDFGGPFDLDQYMTISEVLGRFGSDVKDLFVGGKFLSALWNHFQQSIVLNDEVSRRYGWAVWELDLGHMVAMLHRHPMYTDVSTSAVDYNFDAAVLDLNYLKQMVYIDVQTRDNVQSPNTHRRENEIFCQVGLWRTFRDAHGYIYGITA